MMQIVKHKNDPKKAMIRSKAGKMTAKTTIEATTQTRTIACENLCSVSEPFPGTWLPPSPQRTSSVATRGRALCSCQQCPRTNEGIELTSTALS